MIWLIGVGYLIAGIITAAIAYRFYFDDIDDEAFMFFVMLVWPGFVLVGILYLVSLAFYLLITSLANVGKHANGPGGGL